MLHQGASILTGLGFTGYGPSGETLWEGAANVNVLEIELPSNFKVLLDSWNMKTNVWLRECVYKRVTPKGKKPGFRSSMITFGTSAFWVGSTISLSLTYADLSSAWRVERILPDIPDGRPDHNGWAAITLKYTATTPTSSRRLPLTLEAHIRPPRNRHVYPHPQLFRRTLHAAHVRELHNGMVTSSLVRALHDRWQSRILLRGRLQGAERCAAEKGRCAQEGGRAQTSGFRVREHAVAGILYGPSD